MANALADPLYERLLRSFPANRAYAAADWDGDAMPAPVRHYLDHVLQHHSQREARRLRRARTEWVDYEHPEMQEVVRSFFDAVEAHTQVPSDQWAETLRTATQRTTAHLVRPVPVLTSFVFDEHDKTVPLSQIRWRMRFFGPYGYLREAVQAFAQKRNRDALDRAEFERVLRRVDERMTSDFDAPRWLDLLDPLFATAQRALDRKAVPQSLLTTFFEEKNATPIANRVSAHEPTGEGEAVSPASLRRIIEESTQEEPTAEPRDTPKPSPDFSPHAPFEGVPETSPSPDPEPQPQPGDADRGEETPLWKQFQQGRTRRNPQPDDTQEEDPQPLWTRFQTGHSARGAQMASQDPSPSASSRPSEQSLSAGQEDDLSSLEQKVLGTGHPPNRDLYIQALFNGDTSAYRRVLGRLRTTESWSEASQIIARDVFRANQVNIYSDPAVHFTDAVEATFKK